MDETQSEDLLQDEPSESLQYEKWNVDEVKAFLKEQKIDDGSVDKIYTTFQSRQCFVQCTVCLCDSCGECDYIEQNTALCLSCGTPFQTHS